MLMTCVLWLITIIALLSSVHALPHSHDEDEVFYFDDLEYSGLEKRGFEVVTVTDEFPHRASLSQLRTEGSILTEPYKYSYERSAGEGITVYMVDTGIDLSNRYIADIRPTPRWLLPKIWPSFANNDKDDPSDHGTCVASLVGSEVFGIAKNAQLVIAKTTVIRRKEDGSLTDEVKQEMGALSKNLLEALVLVRDDIKKGEKEKGKGKAVVNLSIATYPDVWELWPVEDRNRFKELLKELEALAPLFIASGNTKNKAEKIYITDLTTYPQLWYKEIPGMILVGSANAAGIREKKSKAAPEGSGLWAAADPVICASTRDSGHKQTHGTSYASAIASGFGAYVMGLPYNGLPDPEKDFSAFVSELFEMLQRSSFPRQVYTVPLISNQLIDCNNRLIQECCV